MLRLPGAMVVKVVRKKTTASWASLLKGNLGKQNSSEQLQSTEYLLGICPLRNKSTVNLR